jgi:glycosidase
MSVLGDDAARAKIAAVALLTLPGLPFIYYGEEIGMLGVKPDEQLRTPMQWSGVQGGGFTTGQPWQALQGNYPQVNVAAQESDPNSLLNLYRRLVQLHTTHPALAQGSYTPLSASSPAVGAFLRHQGDETILVVLNFGQAPAAGVALDGTAPELAPGSYSLQPLLGDAQAAPLTPGAGGAITGYVPLETVAPRTGYIFVLQ